MDTSEQHDVLNILEISSPKIGFGTSEKSTIQEETRQELTRQEMESKSDSKYKSKIV